MHPARLDRERLLADCEVRRQRRSGPGGQHRNKVETGIFIQHLATGLRGEATERRSQHQNLELAVQRLRLRLAVHFRAAVASQSPSELWQSRLRGQRIEVNAEHADFPALLAEAMDWLLQFNWDVKLAAELLLCSPSQLVKLLKREPAAAAELNRQRAAIGLKRLI